MTQAIRGRHGSATRNREIIARAAGGETLQALASEFGITRQRVDQIIYRKRHAARTAARKLRRMKVCEDCGTQRGKIEAHHDDYDSALAVRWLCRSCHRHADRSMREREARRLLGLRDDAAVLTRSEAAKEVGVAPSTFTAAIKKDALRSVQVGVSKFVSLKDLLGWHEQYLARLALERELRRKKVCVHGHRLTDWNRNAQGACAACAAEKQNSIHGREQPRLTHYAIKEAFADAGFTIDDAAGRLILVSNDDVALKLTCDKKSTWRVAAQGLVRIGEIVGVAEIDVGHASTPDELDSLITHVRAHKQDAA